ncbi:MAG: PD-(D/E)XK nuclease family transposase [Lachnospiraceae bacterium]|nr:PD-(D/E)XK nuclease family transposase [Lachnospiraceae bacterium]
MRKNLQKYFPMIKTREEILATITNNPKLYRRFSKWDESQQNDFLDFCSGAKGIKILYDSFFKEVFNPEYSPRRLNKLLSVIMGMKVTIIKVLPIDSTRMADETSLVAMDIVVELEDGSIINVEIQKIGYLFPGQRSACYSADLLLRQYKRIRNIHKENNTKFHYDDIKPVYTIVFFEKSPQIFKEFPNDYIHRVKYTSDTGVELELLQKYIFIPLDIFQKVRHNKTVETELEAWLTFLSSDDVEDIIELIEKFPEFKPLYETLYRMCENIEGVMNVFSEELYQLDKNTVEFMVDEFSRTIEEQKVLLAEKDAIIAKLMQQIKEQNIDEAVD